MRKITCLAWAASLLASATAFAQEKEGGGGREFGDQGVIAVGAATSLDLSYTSTSPPAGSGSNAINVGIEPEVQYFVINGLSLGGVVVFDWTQAKDSTAGSSATTVTSFGIGPTVGYNVWITPGTLSLWPQAEFLFTDVSVSGSSTTTTTGGITTTSSTPSNSGTVMTLGLFVPLLIHPVKHFHFGVGPYLDVDLSSKVSSGGTTTDGDKNTVFGIKAEIAGWL